jgi:hypothetical protein
VDLAALRSAGPRLAEHPITASGLAGFPELETSVGKRGSTIATNAAPRRALHDVNSNHGERAERGRDPAVARGRLHPRRWRDHLDADRLDA